MQARERVSATEDGSGEEAYEEGAPIVPHTWSFYLAAPSDATAAFFQAPYDASTAAAAGVPNMEWGVDTHPSDLVVAFDAASNQPVQADSVLPLPYTTGQTRYAKSAQRRAQGDLAASSTEHFGYSTCHWVRSCDASIDRVGTPCSATLAGVTYAGFCFESSVGSLECGHTTALDDRHGTRPIAIGVAISPNLLPSEAGVVSNATGASTTVLPAATYRCERGSAAISSGAYVGTRLPHAGCMLSNDSAYDVLADVHVPDYCAAVRLGGADFRRGCLFASALNYDATALQSADCHYDNVGCADSAALNFHSEATFHDAAACIYGIEGCTVNSARQDGSGAPTVLNYDPAARVNVGCILALEGCMDSDAVNYAPDATVNSFTWCISGELGCMRPDFTQPSSHGRDGSASYNPLATRHDPTLCPIARLGCRQSTMANYDPFATVDAPCIPVRQGCLHPDAVNFNCTLRQNAPCAERVPSVVITQHNDALCHFGLLPPAAPIGAAEAVPAATVILTAAGDPSDYDAASRAAIASSFATQVAVDPAAVVVSVEAASVRITVVITFPSASAAQTAGSSIAAVMGDAAAASAFLGISVESAPQVEVGVVYVPISLPPSAPPEANSTSGCSGVECTLQSAPFIGGSTAGGALILFCCVFCCFLSRKRAMILRQIRKNEARIEPEPFF